MAVAELMAVVVALSLVIGAFVIIYRNGEDL